MRKLIFIVFVLAIIVPVVALASWVGVQYAFEKTSDEPFCTSCHAMQAMGETFKQSVHGGNNRAGFTAECNDCHLPHDNVLNYLITKVRMGTNDLFTELTSDPADIDWIAKLEHSDRYVYDSGCMHCHKNLKITSEWVHESYFSGGMESCLGCHKEVAHPGLAGYLKTSLE